MTPIKPTLQDIAEQAGVSTATVSRVLNDRPGVNEDTRTEVLRVAKDIGYVPSITARGLATDRTYNLGFVTYKRDPQPISSYHQNIIEGIDQAARESGCHVITTYIKREEMNDISSFSMLREQRVDGLILAGPALKTSFIVGLYNSHLPIVLLDNLLSGLEIDAVVCDNRGGTYSITNHLIESHSLRRLVFFSGPSHWLSSKERREGYERAMLEIDQKPEVVYMLDTTMNTGYDATGDALKLFPDLEGIVAVNDASALGAIKALKDHGLDVPNDVAVVGFDNVTWGPLNEPALTTVRMYKREMGFQAARRLIDVIERAAPPGFQLRLSTELIVRESCGCPKEASEPFYIDFGS